MRYYMIAGEASGDLHGSNLVKELKLLDSNPDFRFWGGDLMAKQAGSQPVMHYKDIAYMGFLEVILHLSAILKNISFCKKDILKYHPDVLILIDYPGFNLRIAEFAHKNNIKVYYYISPTIWAWHESRVYTVKKYVDRMFVILPFEKDFYKKFDYNADFVGHPMLDTLDKEDTFSVTDFYSENNLPHNKQIIAILPGSRKQEIHKILPVMLSVTKNHPSYTFIIAGISSLPAELYQQYLQSYPEVRIINNKTQTILKHSYAAMVKSGTSTLEAALMEVPQVVCYKTSYFTYRLAKWFAKVKYISIVNLVMESEVVKELIQYDLNEQNLKHELDKILLKDGFRNEMSANYKELKNKLGGQGASARLADKIYNSLNH